MSEFVSPNVIYGSQVKDARTDEENTNLTMQYMTNIRSYLNSASQRYISSADQVIL